MQVPLQLEHNCQVAAGFREHSVSRRIPLTLHGADLEMHCGSVRHAGSVACDKSWTSLAATDLSANQIAVMQIHWDGPGLVNGAVPEPKWHVGQYLDSTFEFPCNTLVFPHNNHKCCEFSIESITNIINYIHSESKNWYDISVVLFPQWEQTCGWGSGIVAVCHAGVRGSIPSMNMKHMYIVALSLCSSI